MIQQSGKEKKGNMLKHQKPRKINLNQDANYKDVKDQGKGIGFSKVFYMVSENRAFHHSSHKNSGSVWRVRRKIIYILSHELRSGSIRKHVISNQYHFMYYIAWTSD